MNKYIEDIRHGKSIFKNLNRIEFVITYACTGKCKHCSEGDHTDCGEHIDGKAAARALKEIAGQYAIKSLMTFGGEPLLYPEDVRCVSFNPDGSSTITELIGNLKERKE